MISVVEMRQLPSPDRLLWAMRLVATSFIVLCDVLEDLTVPSKHALKLLKLISEQQVWEKTDEESW